MTRGMLEFVRVLNEEGARALKLKPIARKYPLGGPNED